MAKGSNSSGTGKPALTKLQAAFEHAKVAKKSMEKQKGRVESPYILRSVRRSKLVPALTPTGQMRRQPDREAFVRVEALDRSEAIQRRKAQEKDVNLGKDNKNRDDEIDR